MKTFGDQVMRVPVVASRTEAAERTSSSTGVARRSRTAAP
jgi:hypothetical protein